MQWKCKYCEFVSEKRGYLLKHYRLKHGSYSRTVPCPCLHQECLYTFNSINALKVHLSKIHQKGQECENVTFHCQLCDFSASCTEAVFFTHLRSTHLKVHHKLKSSSCHLTFLKTSEPTDIRTLVLRGLPIILGDKPADFYRPVFVSDSLPSHMVSKRTMMT